MCSQCIDRRIAILGAGAASYDPDSDYERDVLLGPREDGYQRNMAVNYARHSTELARLSDAAFAQLYNLELTRAVRGSPNPSGLAQQIIDLHKRHAETVCRVLQGEVESHARDLLTGTLEESCMLQLVAGGEHRAPTWERYVERIRSLLTEGLPRACRTHKPSNESHLQEICDGILSAHDDFLVREFPFLRWSSSTTKPDWSAEEIGMWIEMKYIRKSEDIRRVTEDIAADLTKYGDNERRTLFVVYDPQHLILNEREFSEPILNREGMQVAFLR
jgi:hypothetical protein